jgi:hypothetical protein
VLSAIEGEPVCPDYEVEATRTKVRPEQRERHQGVRDIERGGAGGCREAPPRAAPRRAACRYTARIPGKIFASIKKARSAAPLRTRRLA